MAGQIQWYMPINLEKWRQKSDYLINSSDICLRLIVGNPCVNKAE